MRKSIEVLMTLSFEQNLLNRIRSASPYLVITTYPVHTPQEIPDEVWANAEILYTKNILPTPELAPNLRWIQFHVTGIEHLLGEPILHKPDLIITTLSGAAAPQMAEYYLMALLTLGHRLPEIIHYQRQCEWPANRAEIFCPKELNDSTIGIVGYGSIGRHLARMLQPFGATVLAAKRDAMHPEDNDYVPEGMGDPAGIYIRRLYPWQAICSMLKVCDFVVITAPLTEETRHFISWKEFEAMKPGAYLIDASSGGIVDHEALIETLSSGKLAGAMLDVFPQEPLPSDSPLWHMPNVVITPHIGWLSSKYNERAVALFYENLHRYLGDLPLYNRFDLNRGY